MHNAILPPNSMEELEKNKKLTEQKLSGKELYELRKKQKDENKKKGMRKEKIREMPKKIVRYSLYATAVVAIIVGLRWFIPSRPSLPPTTSVNHSELSPEAHIVTKPISDSTQRHMLEHSDGGGAPGIIVQYNCDDFDCEPDLIQKLTDIVEQYPSNVYLAPNKYDGKIILTKLSKREILESFDEQTIENFIE